MIRRILDSAPYPDGGYWEDSIRGRLDEDYTMSFTDRAYQVSRIGAADTLEHGVPIKGDQDPYVDTMKLVPLRRGSDNIVLGSWRPAAKRQIVEATLRVGTPILVDKNGIVTEWEKLDDATGTR